MKRPLVATLIIGFVVAGIIGALHASGLLLRLELLGAELIPHHRTITRSVAGGWQYVFIVILSLGVAGLTLTSSRRERAGWLVLALLIELLGLCWIWSLYRIFFQPLPSMFAVVLALVVDERSLAIARRSRAYVARSFFAGL